MQDLKPEPKTITHTTKLASFPVLCHVILFFPFSRVSISAAFRQLRYCLLTEQYILDISGGLSCKFKQWENQWPPLLIHEKGCHCEKTVGRCGCLDHIHPKRSRGGGERERADTASFKSLHQMGEGLIKTLVKKYSLFPPSSVSFLWLAIQRLNIWIWSSFHFSLSESNVLWFGSKSMFLVF